MTKTLTIIKPIAFQKGYAGRILDIIYSAGFKIISLKITHLSIEQAKEFYKVHVGKDFFDDLAQFMSSGPIIVAILEKKNAVEDYRKLIGKTNPAEAEEHTIRHIYGTSQRANAVHGSDSDENAEFECNFFFTESERYNVNNPIKVV